MLAKIPYSMYSLGNMSQLSENLTKKASELLPDDAMISASASKVKEALEIADVATKSGIGSALTEEVSNADHLRDACYRSLRDHIKAGLERETNPAYRESSEKLWNAFKHNNTLLANLPYKEETEALRSLFADLEPMKTDLDKVHATDWLQELIDANDAFEKVMSEAGTDVPTDQDAKSKLKTALKIFVSTVNSLWSFGQPEGIKEVVIELNEIIREANEGVKN